MPNRRLDIIGKSFGKLTAIRYAGHSKNRSLLVECECSCKGNTGWPGKAVVAAVELTRKPTNDHKPTRGHKPTGSCGCLRSSRPMIEARMRVVEAAHAGHDTKTDEKGKRWLSRRALMNRLEISTSTVDRWIESCRFLDDRGISSRISSRPFEGAFGQESNYYSEADAEAIEKSRDEMDAIPDRPGKIAVQLACSSLGLSGAELTHFLRKIKKRATREKAGVRANGWLCARSYITMTVHKSLQEKLRWGENDLTETQAAEVLGCCVSTVENLRHRKVLLVERRFGKHADGIRREGWVYSRKEVMGLHAARLKRPQSGRVLWNDPRTDEERKESRRTPAAPPAANAQKHEREKPSRERHLKWQQWRLEGFSFGEIQREERREGRIVTRESILAALKRLGKTPVSAKTES